MSDSTDPVVAYEAASRRLEEAVATVEACVRDVKAVAAPHIVAKLSDWRAVLIGDMKLPPTVLGGPGVRGPWRRIEEDACPEAGTLKAALLSWRDAHFALQAAWQRLPLAERANVTPPD